MFFSVDKKTDHKKNISAFLTEGTAAWFLAAGILLTLEQWVDTGCPAVFYWMGAGIAILILQLLSLKKWAFQGTFLFAGVILAAVLAGVTPLVNGLTVLYNTLVQTVGESTGIVLPKFVLIRETTVGRDMEASCFVLAFAVGMIFFWIIRSRWFWLAIVVALPAFLTAGQAGNVKVYAGPLLTGLGVTGALALSVYGTGKRAVKNHTSRLVPELYLYLSVFMLAGVLLASTVFPSGSRTVTGISKALQDNGSNLLNHIRYEKKKINSLPKGRVDQAGSWSATEDTALTVTADQLESCYLRGFVGSSFDGSKWKHLKTEDYYNNNGLFYWLHQAGLYGNAQLDLARSLVEDKSIPDQDQVMKITNENADSEYIYTPYEVKAGSWSDASVWENSDETLRSFRLYGSRSYEYHVNTGLTSYFPELAAETFLSLQDKKNTEYEQAESYYNAFVYEHYIGLTKSQTELLSRELGEAGDQTKGHIDYYSAITKIRECLQNNFIYDKACKKMPEGRNFLNYFLTESRTGYDVHFATVAALMFRYYGIPARYTEGYVITEDDLSGKEPAKTLDIPASNGHAWPEIYVDGIGWVPIEVSPDYLKRMKQPDLTKGLQAGTRSAQQAAEPQETNTHEEETSLPELLRKTMFDLVRLILILLLVFDIILILFMIVVALRRAWACCRRKKGCNQEDNRKAVLYMMKYAMSLLLYGQSQLYGSKKKDIRSYLEKEFSGELVKLYDTAVTVGEKAAFSKHEITWQEKASVQDYMKKLKEEKLKKNRWFDRFMMRYIERLC